MKGHSKLAFTLFSTAPSFQKPHNHHLLSTRHSSPPTTFFHRPFLCINNETVTMTSSKSNFRKDKSSLSARLTSPMEFDKNHPPPRRIIWDGPLFSRLTKSGKEYLEKCGWERLDCDYPGGQQEEGSTTATRLVLVWPSKSGPQFEVDDNNITSPIIRPFPKRMTDIVDDKIHLSELLEGTSIIPRRILSPFEEKVADADPPKLYFVKYRTGAKGKVFTLITTKNCMNGIPRQTEMGTMLIILLSKMKSNLRCIKVGNLYYDLIF